jgi:hypothetical protein
LIRRSAAGAAATALAVALIGCSLLPTDRPADAARRALERVAAHDLIGASQFVCADRRNPMDLPFGIGGILAPIGAMPDSDIRRNLAIMTLDISRMTVTETSVGDDVAELHVGGTLVTSFDPPSVEALFRAMAAEQGQPVDEALLAQTMANVSAGSVPLSVDEDVPAVREQGSWKVCPPAATP